MTSEDLRITRHNQGSSGEYHAHVIDSEAVGRLTWVERPDGARIAEHTLVPSEIGGRGIAAELVRKMVADARQEGFKIVPQCSYVAAKFRDNPDWNDLLA